MLDGDCNPQRYSACFEVLFLSRCDDADELVSACALYKTDLITFVEWLMAGYRVIAHLGLCCNYCEELTESICREGAEW